MVLGIANGVVRVGGSKEISRDQLCSLVDQLVEGMLTIGPSSTPDNRLFEVVSAGSKGRTRYSPQSRNSHVVHPW